VGDLGDCPRHVKREKKEVLNMLREMWLKGDSPLRRIYSSWEQLEANLEIKLETTSIKEERKIQSCPNCGAKQNVVKPMEGIFPYQNCESCKHPFYVDKDLKIRKLTEEEKREIPGAWIHIVEDLNRKKIAVVFRLE
jgi:hypothetical protein